MPLVRAQAVSAAHRLGVASSGAEPTTALDEVGDYCLEALECYIINS
jgi:hypothetical protein